MRSSECTRTAEAASNRLFVKDKTTGWDFLVDSGAEVSVLPPHLLKKRQPTPHRNLRAANQSLIVTYGDHVANISIGFPHEYSHRFLVADVNQPVLGADFLTSNGLLIDLSLNSLLDSTTGLSVYGVSRSSVCVGHSVLSNNQSENTLSHDFPTMNLAGVSLDVGAVLQQEQRLSDELEPQLLPVSLKDTERFSGT